MGGYYRSPVIPSVNGFRLSTESGVGLSTSDRTSQGTIYWSPFTGNVVALYHSLFGGWNYYTTAGLSINFSSTNIVSGSAYDVYVYPDANNVPQMELLVWTNDTTRATSLTLSDGVWQRGSAGTGGTGERRLVGVIKASGTNVVEDSDAKRWVTNVDNIRPRKLRSFCSTGSWTYGTATYRESNGGTNQQRAQWMQPVGGNAIEISGSQNVTPATSSGARCGIGFNATNGATGKSAYITSTATIPGHMRASVIPASGLNYATIVEYSDSGNSTFSGNEGGGCIYLEPWL